MKTPLLLLISIILGFSVFAQPTVQSSEFYPTIGESYTFYYAFYMSPGSSGNNVTWDLSGLNSYSSHTNNILGPNSNYPSATHTVQEVGGSNLVLDLSSNEYLLVGLIYDWGHLDYTNANKLYQFPMTMGTAFTDSFNGIIYQDGDTIIRTGTAEVEVDGYGTLITPVGTYTNVLRVHNVRTIIDKIDGVTVQTIIDDMYMWIKAGIHHELANIQVSDYDGDSLNSAYYIEGSTLNITTNDLNSSLILSPNPVQNKVTLNLDLNIDKVEIFDLNGRSVFVDYNLINRTIDVSTLNSGIYYIHVYSVDNESVGKIVKR